MKLNVIFYVIAVVFLLGGCAAMERPSLEEQDRQEQKSEQTQQKSDAFAKGLPQ